MLYPKVSCLVITYNQQDFIDEALLSLLSQDYENIEIVVADDNSSDMTPDILERYQQRFPDKLKVITRKNHVGITKNSNRALDLCTGEYLALIGGDDVWLPEKVSKQVRWLLENPEAAICYHDVEAFDSKTRQKLYLFSDHHNKLQGNVKEIMYEGCFAAACSLMISRKDIPNLKFEEFLPHVSDWFFVLETLIQTKKSIGFIPGVYALYRRHDKNVTKLLDLNQEIIDGYKIIIDRYPEYASHAKFASAYHYMGLISQAIKHTKLINAYKFFIESGMSNKNFIRTIFEKIKRKFY